ncbi:MAG: zf-TFIIB domain-containing protein [Sandaracinaceae bacterium]
MDRAPAVPTHVALPAGLAERLQRVADLAGVDRARVLLEAVTRGLPGLETATGASVRVPRCARCGARPSVAEVDGIGMAACRSCGGVWLDNASALLLAKAPSATVESIAAQLAEEASGPRPVDAALACPVCRAPLDRVEHEGVGALDTCGVHGTFFDRGELAPMVARLRQRLANQVILRGANLDADLERVAELNESVRAEGRAYERDWGSGE